jgi:hypothetical protein
LVLILFCNGSPLRLDCILIFSHNRFKLAKIEPDNVIKYTVKCLWQIQNVALRFKMS